MNYELNKSLLSWPLFYKPERLQVMLAILLSREEDGSVTPCAVEQLPMITGLSLVTVQRSIQDLIDAGILMCVTGMGIPTQLVVTSLPDGLQQSSVRPIVRESGTEEIHQQSVPPVPAPPRRTSKRFVKPSLEQLSSYVSEKGYTFSPQSFLDYYDSVGWMVGPGKHMKDWKAACRTWNNRRSSQPHNPITSQPNHLTSYEQQRINARAAYLAAESGSDPITDFRHSEVVLSVEALAGAIIGSIHESDGVAASLPAYKR